MGRMQWGRRTSRDSDGGAWGGAGIIISDLGPEVDIPRSGPSPWGHRGVPLTIAGAGVEALPSRDGAARPAAVLLRYRKLEPARWLGHLDVMRAFERAFRRTDLPVAYTEGYNPRIRLAFASPLPVGVTGDREAAVVLLSGTATPQDVCNGLNSVLPSGFEILNAEAMGTSTAGSVLAEYDRAEYVMAVRGPHEAAQAGAEALMGAETLPVTREKDRRIIAFDARPFLHAASAEAGSVRITVEVRQNGGVRPSELGALLEARAPECRVAAIVRARLFGSGSAPSGVAPEQDETEDDQI
ncbi:MAG: TIGR03936 family radical SAM-associated protein [Armatimonadetes bacterium]|nr:TIGR03936 family radical SAM-associated protein [Armatimonadota bacterium]